MKIKIVIKTGDEKKEFELGPNGERISDESEVEIVIEKENKKEKNPPSLRDTSFE